MPNRRVPLEHFQGWRVRLSVRLGNQRQDSRVIPEYEQAWEKVSFWDGCAHFIHDAIRADDGGVES